MNPKSFLIGSCVVFLAGCQNQNRDILERSQRLADSHNFHQAYWVVAQALDESPFDEELDRAFTARRLDYLLDRGQQLVFEEQELRAIEEFRKALVLDPGNRHALAWIARAKAKLAQEALDHAETHRHEGDLEGALKLYNKALAFAPELPDAVEGIAKVNELYQGRIDKSVEHYTLGARARGEQLYRQSYYHAQVAKQLDESNARAKNLFKLTGRRLAEKLFEKAKKMEQQGYYAAAWQDYRTVQASFPDIPGLDERIEAMSVEIEVRNLCREAEMLIRKHQFEGADKKLAEAFDMTRLEKAKVSGLMLQAKNQRYEEAYVAAKDLEYEFMFAAALEAFSKIDKAYPNRGFLDVKARISALKSYIEEAEKSFVAGQAAEKAGKLKEALDHYEEAVLVYPGYKDLDTRIKDLRSRL